MFAKTFSYPKTVLEGPSSASSSDPRIKIVIVGDSAVGKTSLLTSFVALEKQRAEDLPMLLGCMKVTIGNFSALLL